MAAMNIAIFTGVVPDFKGKGNAVIANNIEDENKANVILKLDVQRRARTQDGSYENKSDVLTFHAVGKTAHRRAALQQLRSIRWQQSAVQLRHRQHRLRHSRQAFLSSTSIRRSSRPT